MAPNIVGYAINQVATRDDTAVDLDDDQFGAAALRDKRGDGDNVTSLVVTGISTACLGDRISPELFLPYEVGLGV
eukprot:gene2566-3097_t